ncbi:MAG: hypothetical protein DIU54_002810 [Acidobacteriota bacterium]|nr:MAG: hypothetical protein DIU54_02185 [Acidobacteriota bacterium]
MQSSLSRPYVVSVIPDTPVEAEQITVADLLIGSVSMAGVLLAVALVLGLVFGVLRVGYLKLFTREPDHMPPVSPFD